MKSDFIHVRLEPAQAEALTRLQERSGVSKSEFVRRAINLALNTPTNIIFLPNSMELWQEPR
jgi:Ribbon-helix-helix protein, copG family